MLRTGLCYTYVSESTGVESERERVYGNSRDESSDQDRRAPSRLRQDGDGEDSLSLDTSVREARIQERPIQIIKRWSPLGT